MGMFRDATWLQKKAKEKEQWKESWRLSISLHAARITVRDFVGVRTALLMTELHEGSNVDFPSASELHCCATRHY